MAVKKALPSRSDPDLDEYGWDILSWVSYRVQSRVNLNESW